jgi:hypothetical protein
MEQGELRGVPRRLRDPGDGVRKEPDAGIVRTLVRLWRAFLLFGYLWAWATTTDPNIDAVSTSNVTSYGNAEFAPDLAFTPAVNDLVVVAVATSGSIEPAAAGALTDDRSGTYTLAGTANRSGNASTVYWFVRDQAVSSAVLHTLTFTCTGDAATGACAVPLLVAGMSKYGATAIKQFKATSGIAAGGTPSVTFDAACDTNNPVLLALGAAANPPAVTPPTGWTEAADIGIGTPAQGLEVAYRDSGHTTGAITYGSTSSGASGLAALELDASSAGTPATVTPATIAAVAAVPQAGPQASSSVTPATIAAPVATPGAGPQAGATITPAMVSAPAAIPAASAGALAVVTPATLAAAATVPASSPQAGASLTPAAVAVLLAVPQAEPRAGTGRTPATVALVVDLPQAEPRSGVQLTPAAVATVAAVPEAAARAGVSLTPATVAAAAAIAQAAAQAASVVSPGMVPAVVTIPAATALGGGATTVSPAVIAATVGIPQADSQATVLLTPATLATLAALPQTGLSAGATITPATLAALVAVLGASPISVVLREIVVGSRSSEVTSRVVTLDLASGASGPSSS